MSQRYATSICIEICITGGTISYNNYNSHHSIIGMVAVTICTKAITPCAYYHL
ncbi:MAG: hypothetical protein J6B33_01635 [Prevotella sp.]|nr:hypothetical protein [Prevotella sp.]